MEVKIREFLDQLSTTDQQLPYWPRMREILPEQAIEHFWEQDPTAPVYKPQHRNRAQTLLLRRQPRKAAGFHRLDRLHSWTLRMRQ